MIQFTLKCDQDHRFDSWFKSAASFEALAQAGHLNCAICGSTNIAKAMMAPRVAKGGASPELHEPEKAKTEDAAPVPMLSRPQTDVEKAIASLREKVEAHSDYVGADFAKQARDMHEGRAPERSIYGEARPDQARALIEDGVPLMPLPFRPKRSTQ